MKLIRRARKRERSTARLAWDIKNDDSEKLQGSPVMHGSQINKEYIRTQVFHPTTM